MFGLIPILDYAKTLGSPTVERTVLLQRIVKDTTNERWRPYRLTAEQLPPAVLNRLDALSTE